MAVASEQHDGEFFSQLGRMRQAMNRSASAAKRLANGDRSAEVMNDLNVGEIVWRDARGRLQDAASSRAGARGNALLQTAAELNPFGKPYPDFAHPWAAGPANASDSREVKRLADGPVANLLPASWLTFSARHTPIRAELVEIDPALVNFAVLPEGLSIGGGYARAGTLYARHYTGAPDTAYLEIVTGVRTTERGRIRLVLHEICHRVEDAVPGLIEHEREHHSVPPLLGLNTKESDDEARHIMLQHPCNCVHHCYWDALLSFRQYGGDDERTIRALAGAIGSGPVIPLFLIGEVSIPPDAPSVQDLDRMRLEGEEHAAVLSASVASELLPLWEVTPGAKEWLEAKWQRLGSSAAALMGDPSGAGGASLLAAGSNPDSALAAMLVSEEAGGEAEGEDESWRERDAGFMF